MENGFCVKASGSDQNHGVIKVNADNIITSTLKFHCLQKCLAHPGATGCEVIWDQSNRGCYIHTAEVARGNNAPRHNCWIMSSKSMISF